MIQRTGTLTSGTPVVTGLKRTTDIAVGLYVYGTGIDPETTVLSVDSVSQITLTKNATANGPSSLVMTSASPCVFWNQVSAQKDIHDIVNEQGDVMKVVLRSESDVARDNYSSVNKRDQEKVIFIRAYPITMMPNTKQIEKAGLKDRCDVLAYTAYQDWAAEGIEFEDIEYTGRTRVMWRGTTYEIRDKGVQVQLSDSFGYITLGLFKV